VTRRILVVDTNVVVAGLTTPDVASPVAKILDGMLIAAFPFAVSEALLAEYRDVLTRSRLVRIHGLSPLEVEEVLTELASHAIVLKPAAGLRASDPGDQHLWDLLASRDDLVLVTGDAALVSDPAMRGRVITPRVCIERSA